VTPLPASAPLLTSRQLGAHRVPHGFSLRTGGVSEGPFRSLNLGLATGDDPLHVEENLRLFLQAAGIPAAILPTVVQVHGDRVVHGWPAGNGVDLRDAVEAPPLEGVIEADAVVAIPGAAAGVRTADCVPVLLYDPGSGVAAAVHAGWRGTAARLAAKTVQRLVDDYGAEPAELVAAIGPAIGPCCYEVGADVAGRFRDDGSLSAGLVASSPSPRLNLRESNRALLLATGLREEHIELVGGCTACDPDLYFSHRRDAGRTGRHLAVIAAGRF
jgi:YfiH family protein